MLRRQPNIYLFNPTCEYAVANGHASWQPNRVLQKMESDLATLPQFFTQPNDFVLVDKLPSHEFISSVEELHFQSPHFLSTKEALAKPSFLELQKNKLCPWGWSPAAHKLLAPLKPSCSDDFSRSPVSQWKPEYRNFYSKKFARGILERLLSDFPSEQFLPPAMLTRVCTTNQEIEALLENWGKIMVKAPWSSSGRGLQPITKTPVHPKVWEKTAGILREQGYAIVEPFCDKALDLAFEFEFKKGKVTFLGVSYFLTDGKGQYQGNYLNGLPCSTPSEVKKFAGKISSKIIEPLKFTIEQSTLAANYEGCFGVDALIFRTKSKVLKINPCLEINLRQNMGILSFQFGKFIAAGHKGMFRIFYNPGVSFFQFKKEMEKKYPLKLSGGKIKSGFFALTEASKNAAFGAFMLV